jgi:predicted transposase YbfD/YdcC
MEGSPVTEFRSLVDAFSELPDPRIDRTKKHALADLLFAALAAVIAGAESWDSVAEFAETRLDWLRKFAPFANGAPSADTFERVFTRLDAKAFAKCVGAWMAEACDRAGLKHIAIDGKAVRRAKQSTFSGCLHLVSAWAVENRLILGQEAVAAKSNEITAIPKLLEALDLKGALVSLDAAGCQTAIAQQIRKRKGDYLLAVKGNQSTLEAAVHSAFERAAVADFKGLKHDAHESVDASHGRRVERYVTVLYDPEGLPAEWRDAAAVVQVGRERSVKDKTTSEVSYYLTSRRASAKELGERVRRHWAVENELHWCLDVTFREDANRSAVGEVGPNLGVIRRLALSLLKQLPGKATGPTKRLKAALDSTFLERALQGNVEI